MHQDNMTLAADGPETGIVWVDPMWSKYPYLRESQLCGFGPSKAPRKGDFGRLVGYSKVRCGTDAAHNGYKRRVWHLHTDDFVPCADGSANAYTRGNADDLVCDAPVEGVLPESVALNVASKPAYLELRARPRAIP